MALRRFAELPFPVCASGCADRGAIGLARATRGIDCAGIILRYATAHSRSEQFYFGAAQRNRVALSRHFRIDYSGFAIHGRISRETGIDFPDGILLGNRLTLGVTR